MLTNKQIQIAELMIHYGDKGDLVNARKYAKKLIEIDSERLKQLARMDKDSIDYRAVMDEINEMVTTI